MTQVTATKVNIEFPKDPIDRARMAARLDAIGAPPLLDVVAQDDVSPKVWKALTELATAKGKSFSIASTKMLKHSAESDAIDARLKNSCATLKAAAGSIGKYGRVSSSETRLAMFEAVISGARALRALTTQKSLASYDNGQAAKLRDAMRALYDSISDYPMKGDTISESAITRAETSRYHAYSEALDELLDTLPKQLGEAPISHKIAVELDCFKRVSSEIAYIDKNEGLPVRKVGAEKCDVKVKHGDKKKDN